MIPLRVYRLPCYRFPFVLMVLATIAAFAWYEYGHLQKTATLTNVLSREIFPANVRDQKEKEERYVQREFAERGAEINIEKDLAERRVGRKVEKDLAERRALLHEVCSNRKLYCHFESKFQYYDYYFYDYNATICTIAKAGSSTWRMHLRQANKGPPLNIPIFKDEVREAFLDRPLEEIIRDVNATNKIITVRHPLTRLVSAYRNKFKEGRVMPANAPLRETKEREEKAGKFWDDRFYQFWLPALFVNGLVPADAHLEVGLQDPIDPHVRYNTSVYEGLHKLLKPRITFTQFLTYVLHTFEINKIDGHWCQYHVVCCPCQFEYEYITKVETMSEDLEYVFKELGIPSDPNITMNVYNKKTSGPDNDLELYLQVPIHLKKQIYDIVKVDMELFGYEFPPNFLKE